MDSSLHKACVRIFTLIFLLDCLSTIGCSSVVRPPQKVKNPVSIFVVSAALHSGIVLPTKEEGSYVEYGFGEYRWYALNQDAWYRVFPSVFYPTQGALGRRLFDANNNESIRRNAYAHAVHEIKVENSKLVALREKLKKQFSESGQPIWNSSYQMSFAKLESYWLFNSCHDRTALWLKELGCHVTWSPVRLGLKIKEVY